MRVGTPGGIIDTPGQLSGGLRRLTADLPPASGPRSRDRLADFPNDVADARRGAYYGRRILKGIKPADPPIDKPAKRMVIE